MEEPGSTFMYTVDNVQVEVSGNYSCSVEINGKESYQSVAVPVNVFGMLM